MQIGQLTKPLSSASIPHSAIRKTVSRAGVDCDIGRKGAKVVVPAGLERSLVHTVDTCYLCGEEERMCRWQATRQSWLDQQCASGWIRRDMFGRFRRRKCGGLEGSMMIFLLDWYSLGGRIVGEASHVRHSKPKEQTTSDFHRPFSPWGDCFRKPFESSRGVNADFPFSITKQHRNFH